MSKQLSRLRWHWHQNLRRTAPKFPPSASAPPAWATSAPSISPRRSRPATATSTPRGNTAPSAPSARHARLRRAARRDFPHHQGLARKSARRRLRAVGRRKPRRRSASTTSTCCWCIGRTGEPARRDHAGAGQGQAARARAAHRRRQFQHRAARSRRSGSAPSRWWRCRPSITPISTRPSCSTRCASAAGVHRLLPARPRPAVQRSGAGRDRARRAARRIAQIALRWLMQQNVAAIPRSSNPQRIADNFDVFDFTLERRRDGAHRGAQARRRPHRQSGRPRAGVGCVRSTECPRRRNISCTSPAITAGRRRS